MRELIIGILIGLIPLVLRKGYKVAKKTNQVQEYWAWFGGLMIIVTVIIVVIILAEINARE